VAVLMAPELRWPPCLLLTMVTTHTRFIENSSAPGKVRTGQCIPYRLRISFSNFSNFTEPRPLPA
jgi:hypothetical protein